MHVGGKIEKNGGKAGILRAEFARRSAGVWQTETKKERFELMSSDAELLATGLSGGRAGRKLLFRHECHDGQKREFEQAPAVFLAGKMGCAHCKPARAVEVTHAAFVAKAKEVWAKGCKGKSTASGKFEYPEELEARHRGRNAEALAIVHCCDDGVKRVFQQTYRLHLAHKLGCYHCCIRKA